MFKTGDKVIVPNTLDNDEIREYVITRIPTPDTVECGSRENTFYTAFVWPERVKSQLLAVLRERKRLKHVFDESIKSIYELRNQLARKEI